jgi:hypothetical protein
MIPSMASTVVAGSLMAGENARSPMWHVALPGEQEPEPVPGRSLLDSE